jgi:predicted RNA-binding protein with PUA-like domain
LYGGSGGGSDGLPGRDAFFGRRRGKLCGVAEMGSGRRAKGVPVGRWLFKEEPDHYSFQDLQRDGQALWDGVTNNLARQNLRQVREGDRVLYYHTGKVKAVVGEMRVAAGPRPDPASDDPKAVVVEVVPVRAWDRPVALERIKKDPLLAGWELVRLPRLSVLPVSEAQWRRVEELSRMEDVEGPADLGRRPGAS